MPAWEEYDSLDFYIRVAAGGAIIFLLAQLLGIYISRNTVWTETMTQSGTLTESASFPFLNPPTVYWFIPFAIIFILSPLFISLLLSKKNEDLARVRVIPPLALGLISALYIGAFIVAPLFTEKVKPLLFSEHMTYGLIGFFGAFLTAYVSFFTDRVPVLILGRSADRESIYLQKFRIHAGIEEVKERLMSLEIRETLGLRSKPDGDADDGYMMRSRKDFDVQTLIKLTKEDEATTLLRVAFYEKSRYSVRFSKYFIEVARRDCSYIDEVLTNREPSWTTNILEPLSNKSADTFINYVIDDLRGYYVATKKAPRLSVLLVSVAILLFFLTVVASLTGQPSYAVEFTGITDGLIVLVAVMDYVRKRT